MQREILHADMNSCFASIEQAKDPSLRNKAIAVCGSTEERHGIVLAKSQEAKLKGVKTGEVIWMAKQKCPELIIVPPDYPSYVAYSEKARRIYREYSRRVESFGLDECWLDVSGTKRLFGGGEAIAKELRARFKEELGISLSIGISYNKIFAKLGSDYKKPDAQTLISPDNYRDLVWPLPVRQLLFVGPATGAKLNKYGIWTIGDLARSPEDFLQSLLGINGRRLWAFANGYDITPVADYDYRMPVKSVGRGRTFPRDLKTAEEVFLCLLTLAQEVTRRLINHRLAARAVHVDIRGSDLRHTGCLGKLTYPTQNSAELARCGFQSFLTTWNWSLNIRSLTIRAEQLTPSYDLVQTELFTDYIHHEKQENLALAIHQIREKFGKYSVNYACIHNFSLAGSEGPPSTLPTNQFAALGSL